MAADDWYLRLREENQRQLMEQRQETEQPIDSWDKTMEAITQKIDISVEKLTELIRSMNERWPMATRNGEGARSGEQRSEESQQEILRTPTPQERNSSRSSGSAESPENAPIARSLVAGTNDREIGISIGISNQKLAATEVPSEFLSLQQLDGDTPRSELQENLEKFQFQYDFPKVISNFPNLGRINVASSENLVVADVHLANLVNMEVIGKSMTEFGANLLGFSGNSNAYKAFVKMPSRRMSDELMLNTIEGMSSSHPITFDPGGLILPSFTSLRGIATASNWVKGINVTSSLGQSQQEKMPSYSVESIRVIDEGIVKQRLLNKNVIFDPGIAEWGSNSSSFRSWKIACVPCSWKVSSDSSIGTIKLRIFIFDPGGIQPLLVPDIHCDGCILVERWYLDIQSG